jgi:hypothetical protein
MLDRTETYEAIELRKHLTPAIAIELPSRGFVTTSNIGTDKAWDECLSRRTGMCS